MGYKTFVSMNIAIVGTGKLGISVAEKLAAAGHEILIGLQEDADDSMLQPLLDEYEQVQLCSIPYAADAADIIIIATPVAAVRETAYLLDDVRKKVIIDVTNPRGTNEESYINTMNAIKAITGSLHVVKCCNITLYKDMLAPLFNGEAVEVLMAGDSKKAKEVVKILSRDMGYHKCMDFGDNSTVPLLEEMARCWRTLAVNQQALTKVPVTVRK